MDHKASAHTGFMSNSTTVNHEATSNGGAIFSGSRHFTVAGGTFSSVTNHYIAPPAVHPDLQYEIRFDKNTGIVERSHEKLRVRRVYSAKVEGRESTMTVAMYQGHGAEDEWKKDMMTYKSIRHPNLFQMWGAASAGHIYATLFLGDLIPFEQFVDTYRHSSILNVYIHRYYHTEFKAASIYFSSVFQRSLNCTPWIRRSTGRLCADLIPSSTVPKSWLVIEAPAEILCSHSLGTKVLDAPNAEAAAIDYLTMEEYHDISFWDLVRFRHMLSSGPAAVNLGAIISYSLSNLSGELVEIASVNDDSEPITGGWTHCNFGGTGEIIQLYFEGRFSMYRSWPSQANHIFSRLQVKSNFEDYMYVAGVSFNIEIGPWDMTKKPPEGFLFLSPPTDFQTGSSSLCWPDFPAYWSLDPQGAERLSMKDARQLGFPSIVLTTEVRGYSWDKTVYAGLRQFHQAKGFDPDSQEVARYLGEPLYQLSPEADVPFAYVDDKDLYFDKNEQYSVVNTNDGSGETQSVAGEEPVSDRANLSSCTAPHREI
ncbi:hypothetical protein K438DRAFT_881255 [Mycena galopus ATCC 62051]|nr:hypothetical protein K438DRAFT_881255 [Mycena galopus ATCC 62051]